MGDLRRGGRAERHAVLWYRLRGYRLLGGKAWAGGNELDVIARRGRRLVFCEVKSKGGPGFGDPLEMVTPEKQRRLRRAAEAWLAQHPEARSLSLAFDVIALRDGRLRRVGQAF